MRHRPFGPVRYSIVIPAKDEDEETLRKIKHEIAEIPKRKGVECIIVDDGSRSPLACAQVRHSTCLGYGAALKTGIEKAQGEYIITMDGDGQHRVKDALRLIDFIEEFQENAMVIGDRRLTESTPERWIGRKVLNTIAGGLAYKWIPDLNSGLRIFKKSVVVGYEPILCGGCSFTSSITLSMLADNYKVDWLPIRVLPRGHGTSRVKLWSDGWRTLKIILVIGIALRTRRIRGWLRRNRATKWAVDLLRKPIGKLVSRVS